MKYLFGTFSLLFACIWLIPATIWGWNATVTMDRLTRDEGSVAESIGAIAEISKGPAPIAWLRERGEFRKKFSLTELTTERRVQLRVVVAPEEILGTDEAMPDPSLLPLYAMARGPAFMQRYCSEVLADLGSACAADHFETRMLKTGEIRMDVSLNYLPKYDMGDPSGIENGEFFNAIVGLTNNEEEIPTDEAGRIAMFAKARDICAAVRERFGNCIVSSVTHRFPTEDDGWNRRQPSAGLTIFADAALHNRESIYVAARDIAAELYPPSD